MVGFWDGLKSSVGKYCMGVIQVVIGSRFYMNVKAFYCVEVKAFLLVM
jgi:hypothetical protein